MARNTLSNKGSKKKSGRKIGDEELKAASGSNRTLILALVGFTVVAVAVIGGLAFMNAGGGDAENFTANDQGLIPTGETVPEFSGENVNGGGNVSLGGGDATMLVFFASWCPHCQNEAPVISELEEQYEGLDVVMAGVDGDQGDEPEAVRRFVETYDIESPAIYQPELGGEYNVSGYPTVYVLNGENEVVGAHSGEAPREVFESWIEDALA
ncbi:MAG: TlpA family protein disulfide reductase [Rubrobacter sp.]|nr:TlpA family protein disulfide reductase [Rubrobacter sp.]